MYCLVMYYMLELFADQNMSFFFSMQVKLEANVAKSAKYYGINLNLISSNDDGETEDGNEADVEGEGLDADLATGNKDTCVLEVI